MRAARSACSTSTTASGADTPAVRTIGHSTRPLEAFIALLLEHGVRHLADVRTVPRSKRHPHFDRARLPAVLAPHGIVYSHIADLGGLRKPRPDSVNLGWKNEGFRGYADHMETPAFAAALDRLIALAMREPTAIMCAEAVPWRCHRSLIADALIARGAPVEHILGPGERRAHALTPFASVAGGVTYPGPEQRLPGI
jgi:uncharacterized protein (DUF488 family)